MPTQLYVQFMLKHFLRRMYLTCVDSESHRKTSPHTTLLWLCFMSLSIAGTSTLWSEGHQVYRNFNLMILCRLIPGKQWGTAKLILCLQVTGEVRIAEI